MKDKFFLDTNIIVYSFNKNSKGKKAREIISNVLKNRTGCIGTQVVQEFLNVAIRKFKKPLTNQDCRIFIKKILSPLCEVYPDMELFEFGLDIQEKTGYSFYDSMIIAAAKKGRCTVIYSEDFQDGHLVEGIKIINPLKNL